MNSNVNINVNINGVSQDQTDTDLGDNLLYAPIILVNSTPYHADGDISYAACRHDSYSVHPWETSKEYSRGACLLKKISAQLRVGSTDIEAQPYTSSGTSFGGKFIIVQLRPNEFAVTRFTP